RALSQFRNGGFVMNNKISKPAITGLLCCLLSQFTMGPRAFGFASQSSPQSAIPTVQQSPEELQQLVAPIALYPDALVAQILAAATYPTEVVEAERWMQQHPDLKGDALAQAVDSQSWDPSVKALTQLPSVLAMMDKSLS